MQRMREQRLGLKHGKPGATTRITVAVGANTAAFTARRTYRIAANTNCHILFHDGTGTATSSDPYIISGIPEYFTTDTDLDNISVIRDTADGFLYVTEMEADYINAPR